TNPYVYFGSVEADRFIIDGTDYFYNTEFLSTDYYNQRVAIYAFADAFIDSTDTTLYGFFKIDNYIAVFDAIKYFDPIFLEVSNAPKNQYFIISKDGLINYQIDHLTIRDKLFEHYVRGNSAEEDIAQIVDNLYAGKTGIAMVNFDGKQSYLAYSPLSKDFSTRHLFVVHVFAKTDVLSSMSYLGMSLIIVLVLVALLFAVVLFGTYHLLRTKNSDVEAARLIYYYSKPYIVRVSASGKIRYFNKTCKSNLQSYQDYQYLSDFKTEVDSTTVLSYLRKQRPFTASFTSISGSEIFIRFIPLRSGFGYYLLGEDITAREQDYLMNRNMALYTKTTKLPNKNYLIAKLKDLFNNEESLGLLNSLVAFDISSFKNINNLFGMKIGDETLITLANIVKESLKDKNATLFNTEADNFVVLFERVESFNEVKKWVESTLELLAHPVEINKNLLILDVKMGIFNIESEIYGNLTPTMAYDHAMVALKRAKNSRTAKYVTYDLGLGQYITREQIMETDLVKAIQEKEFVMYLQPQFDNEQERIVGFESLIRWNNPKYLLESPAHFIALAEQNNLIIEIGKFVILDTFRIAKEFEPYNVHISINISPVQLLQAGFVSEIVEIYDRFELKPHAISVEITETFLMTNFDSVIEKLKLLKNHGFNIHLDDFGTGYSSMLYLKDLPIDTIKIDKEFVRHLNTDKFSRAIVSKVISMAKSLDLDVIAEGVEDDKQNQFLVKSGCNVIQGHLISAAVPESVALKLINEYNINKTKEIKVKSKTKEK
ncbi:MAG TPA: GGDEF domain-containing phosphodiesterase, partial [Bacilli bacterium]|nr:GGDEF domain-containing phosphodiesterase [Bacilli bacterium]